MANTFGEVFARGGWVMWPLLAFSILSWTVILERLYVFFTVRPKLLKLARSVKQSVQAGDLVLASQLCRTEKPIIANLFLEMLDPNKPEIWTEKAMERNRIKLLVYLKKNLWILGTISSASPFVGLLGTVVGIVRAFQSMAEHGTGGFSVVAGGISESLVATAAGLIVAIISILMYNFFTQMVNQTLNQLKLLLEEMFERTRGIPTASI